MGYRWREPDLPAVPGLDHLVALVLEVCGHEVEDVLAVLHHEDYRAACARLGG